MYTGTLSGLPGRNPRAVLAALDRLADEPEVASRIAFVQAGTIYPEDEALSARCVRRGWSSRSASFPGRRRSRSSVALPRCCSSRPPTAARRRETLRVPLRRQANPGARRGERGGAHRQGDRNGRHGSSKRRRRDLAALRQVASGEIAAEYAPTGAGRYMYPAPAEAMEAAIETAIARKAVAVSPRRRVAATADSPGTRSVRRAPRRGAGAVVVGRPPRASRRGGRERAARSRESTASPPRRSPPSRPSRTPRPYCEHAVAAQEVPPGEAAVIALPAGAVRRSRRSRGGRRSRRRASAVGHPAARSRSARSMSSPYMKTPSSSPPTCSHAARRYAPAAPAGPVSTGRERAASASGRPRSRGNPASVRSAVSPTLSIVSAVGLDEHRCHRSEPVVVLKRCDQALEEAGRAVDVVVQQDDDVAVARLARHGCRRPRKPRLLSSSTRRDVREIRTRAAPACRRSSALSTTMTVCERVCRCRCSRQLRVSSQPSKVGMTTSIERSCSHSCPGTSHGHEPTRRSRPPHRPSSPFGQWFSRAPS